MAESTKVRCTVAQARLLAVLIIYGPALCPRAWGPTGPHFQFRVKDTCEERGWIKEERYTVNFLDRDSIMLSRFAITEAGRAALRPMWKHIRRYFTEFGKEAPHVHPVHI